MKKIKYISLAFLATVALVACGGGGDSDDPVTPEPKPSEGKFILMNHNMPAAASQETVALTGLTSKITKSAGENDASWLTVTQEPYTSGTPKVTLKTQDNTNTTSRSSFLVFVAARDTVALKVIQAAYSGQGGTDINNPNDTQTDQPAYARGE